MDDLSHDTGISEDTLLTSGSGHATKKEDASQTKSRSESRTKSRTKSRSRSKSKTRSKSKSSKSRSKSKSRKSKSKKVKDFGWWDLENDPELIAALEAEGLREKARIAQDEAMLNRRKEIFREFMQQHIDDLDAEEEEKRVASRTKGVAQRFLQQVQQKERETKPVVLNSVRAAPLKIDVSKWEAPKFKKDADEKALIKNTAKKHFLFKDRKDCMKELSTSRSQKSNLNTGIASNTVAMMIKAFEPVHVDKGKAIIQQGKLDQHLYVIDKGKVEFQVDDATVATGGVGTTFGDQNLLHAEPAKRTIVATETTKVFRLHQETYRGILQQRHVVEDLKKKQKEKEKERTKEKIRQEKQEKEKEIAKLKESDESQSEEEKEKKRAKKAQEEKLEEEEVEWWRDEKNAQLQLAIAEALQRVHQDELERIRVLGEGQFGEVWLVAANLDIEEDENEEDSKRYEFALKLQETFDEYREETALSEIRVMKEVSGYPFVSMLYRSYETEESKDMLLGLIPGGELWDTIHKEDEETGEWLSGLSEGQSRFYALLVADTLDYLHSKHYVFRDLKPENIMLDGWGYPIVVDFGFCKRLANGPNDKTFTFCGTPNYVSPEIVLNVGHNGAADCWALGIVIYEMIAGINPFFWDDMDQVELYRAICEDAGEPLDERHHSRQVRKLVDALLTKDPDKRMNAKAILKHGWFEGLSLQKMRKRQVRAPWIPPGGQGETAEYYCDYTDDVSTATVAHKKREQEIEEELQRMKKEGEVRQRKREEEEAERLRLLAEEQERLEDEERLREEEERRIQEEMEKLKRLEEELKLQREEEERLQREEELNRQRQLEEELLRAEEERLRVEEEERLRLEEEERLRLEEEERLREEEEWRLRLEEEQRIRMEGERLRAEEEERHRVEEELRLQREAEERHREEEERHMRKLEKLRLQREAEEKRKREKEKRKKEQTRLKVLEEQRLREEEEERQRQKEIRRQKMLEEQARQKEEEERQRKLHEEEERLQKELDEQQRRLEEEEERQREIALHRRREMEELEQQIEEKEQEDQQRRLNEEEERQREVAARRRMQLEAEMEKHERKINMDEQAWRHRRNGDTSFGDGEHFLNKVTSWEESPGIRANRSFRTIEDISPVPKGYVNKTMEEYRTRSPRTMAQSPGALDVRRSVKKGIVAKRLSAAKEREDPGNVPSMFASFSRLEKNKKKKSFREQA